MPPFRPPYPKRPTTPYGLFKFFSVARRDLLAIWSEKAYRQRMGAGRLLNRQILLCNTPDAVREALITKHTTFQRKSPQMRHALTPLLGDGLFISDGKTWSKRRKIVGPIIHASRLSLFAPMMSEAADEVARHWTDLPPGTVIDALAEMAHLTAEIICRTIFGRQLGKTYAQEIVQGFSTYQRHIGSLDFMSLLGLPDSLPRPHGFAIRRARKRILDVLDTIIDSYRERREADTGEDSMIGLLLDARDDETGEPLARSALRNEAAVIFMAGHETTANTLAWAWYLISQSPAVEARFHGELAEVLNGRAATLADVPKLIYTRAIIDETLRLYPPVPYLARQALGDETIRNRKVRAGTVVIICPWLLHRHQELWQDPDDFIPERFLPENAAALPSRYGYVPFSIGPRNCAGLAFGLTEAVLCLATLAARFRLTLMPGTDVQPQCRLTLRPGDTLPMRVEALPVAPADRGGETTPLAPPASGSGSGSGSGCPVHHGP